MQQLFISFVHRIGKKGNNSLQRVQKRGQITKDWPLFVVGVRRFELRASWSRTKRATICATPRSCKMKLLRGERVTRYSRLKSAYTIRKPRFARQRLVVHLRYTPKYGTVFRTAFTLYVREGKMSSRTFPIPRKEKFFSFLYRMVYTVFSFWQKTTRRPHRAAERMK